MTYMAILAAVMLVPAVVLVLFKANGGVAFLALCLGSILALAVGPDVAELLASFSPANTLVIAQWTKVVLLLLPFVATLFLTKGNVHGTPKTAVNVIVSLAAGALLAVLVIPLLPRDIQLAIKDEALWREITNLYTAIIIVGSITSMAMLFHDHRPHVDKKHK
ncbi:MAG: hypothetical protein WAS36_02915 [Candidatus Saccharimonadales bacterium]